MLKYKCLMEKKEIDFGNHLVKNIIICDLYKIAKIK